MRLFRYAGLAATRSTATMYKGIYPPRPATRAAQAAILPLLPARAPDGSWAEGLTLADLVTATGLSVTTVRHALNLLRTAGRVHAVAIPAGARWDGATAQTLVWFRTSEAAP